jgi:FkbM family methyltransferase
MPQLVFQRFAQIAASVLGPAAVRTIVEVGARDCVETLDFESGFPEARIFAFECNPATLPACRLAVQGHDRIRLVEKAVSDRRGTVTFYPTDPARTVTKHANGNPGASSLFRASPDYPHETYVQNEISVEATTLADFMGEEAIASIDLLWMDIQGAELFALKGLGDRLSAVGLIHMEVEFMPIYQGQPLFHEVHEYLGSHGFTLLGFTSYSRYSGDAVYASPRCAGPLAGLRLGFQHPYLVRNRLQRIRHAIKRALLGNDASRRP